MKLVRFGASGAEKPGLFDAQGVLRDLSGAVPDIDSALLAQDGLKKLTSLKPEDLPVVEGEPRIGPCVGKIGKIVCVGLNYSDHAKESGAATPTEPILFLKPSSSICGPYDGVEIPRGSEKTDWEVELGVVIGRRAKYVDEAKALDYVAGYCLVNDVSERAYQLERLGQWDKGKGHDTFAPIGPWLVTRDEVPNPQALRLWTEVNGKRYQDGSTANMIFDVKTLICYISKFMTLEPGDIISTGTPAGVGMGQSPVLYLREGDVMKLGIQGLGEQQQRCIAPT
ncbi:fumarylacetoacetate hydrolase family protein [Pollutimonas harenae]|uniref:Fumarylacetoacetate hydrolase family protein n=1 Tax=Pollutimonas harenae TaxID=657015 RepID=A0A853GR04_9BURK|nr:fumarylacetoacetate hydrolase family protein [Pollutimonas harenae]NYT84587.1 fumarylacetoacetate hydrolase family protein [Pollutimonas harenae]TEA73021.1 FAA hydrolase family protein [Pollutimonas harenae]